VSAEMWQFLAVGAVALAAVMLWIVFIYLPRRTGEGEGDGAAVEVPEAPDKLPEEQD
jgi:hypothetical protein